MLKALTVTLALAPGLALANYGPDLTYETANGATYVQVAHSQPIDHPSTEPEICDMPQFLTAETQNGTVLTIACAGQ